MRTILLVSLTVAGMGLAGTTGVSALPANGAVIGDAATAADHVTPVQWGGHWRWGSRGERGEHWRWGSRGGFGRFDGGFRRFDGGFRRFDGDGHWRWGSRGGGHWRWGSRGW